MSVPMWTSQRVGGVTDEISYTDGGGGVRRRWERLGVPGERGMLLMVCGRQLRGRVGGVVDVRAWRSR